MTVTTAPESTFQGRAITVWIWTEAIETILHRHLEEELRFLQKCDPDLHALILSIQEQELAPLTEAEHSQKRRGMMRKVLLLIIGGLTDLMIWLSTWGDCNWMRPQMARDALAE